VGFFDSLGKAVGAVVGIRGGYDTAPQNEAEVAERQTPLTIINPSPQSEIDAGAQRGVINGVKYHLSSGDDVMSMEVWLFVRARLVGGELGPETSMSMRTSSKVARQLKRGWEIPLEFDPATGIPATLDARGIASSLKG